MPQDKPVDVNGDEKNLSPEQQDYIDRATKADVEIAEVLKKYEVEMFTECEWLYSPKGIKVIAHIKYGDVKSQITSDKKPE